MERADEKLLEVPSEDLLRVPPQHSDLRWCCLYTRPRHEKSVAMQCYCQEVGCYLPLRRVIHRYKSGKKTYWLPLFTGYVFCVPSPEKRIDLSRDERVLSLIEVADQKHFLGELLQIYRGLEVSAELKTVPYLAKGRRVEIVRGPFKGIKGVVERAKSGFRVMLIATIMNSSVPLEVDAGDVEVLDD